MRIAQVSPLWESVPPKLYGGTERIVSYLTEGLVQMGHNVTLFASGDSITAARLVSICPEALRLSTCMLYRDAPVVLQQERVLGAVEEFDIIHFHIDMPGFPVARRCKTPTITTMHGRLDLPELRPAFHEFADMALVSISDAQRHPLPLSNWVATVHHGLPRDLYGFHPRRGKYLAFLGRITPEKHVDLAIEIAKRTNMRLRIASKIDPVDRAYFEAEVEPLLHHPLIEYLGEINDVEKDEFLGDAKALVCPYDSTEAFGLVLIEALACGTPVITYDNGPFPEIIEDGVTGFLCRSVRDMVEAVGRVPLIDRHRCRQQFEERFTAERMTQEYLDVYRQLLVEPRRTAVCSPAHAGQVSETRMELPGKACGA
jgi:glycosyltransferase involved in cell wall biosynthesis